MPLLEIDIEARYAKFQDALTAMQRDTKKAADGMSRSFGVLKSFLAGLGAVVTVGVFTSLIKDAIDAADHLNDLSKQTGVAVDTLGGLGFAAGQAGGDLESIADAAGKLNKSIAGAASGNKEFRDGFKALGIDIKDANGNLKTVDQVLVEIANKFQGYADGPEKVAIATRLLGKAGAEQIALLNDGGRALQENIEYYKRYSGVTQETADNADAFNDTLGKLHLISGAFGRTLAAELLPSLQGVANAFLDVKENGDGFHGLAVEAADGIKVVTRVAIEGAQSIHEFGIEVGAIVPLFKALGNLDFKKIQVIDDETDAKLNKAREAYGKFIAGVKNGAPPDPVANFLAKYADQIKGEEVILKDRNAMLTKYNKENLISDKEFNTAKIAAQNDAAKNIGEIYDVQILNVQNALKKGIGDQKQLQSILEDLAKKRAMVGKEKPRAPGLPGANSDASSQILEGQLREFERNSDAEQRLLSSRNDFLQTYYQEDLISLQDYYDGRRAAQEEALSAQKKNIVAEIALLSASRPKDAQKIAERDNKVADLVDKKAALEKAAGETGIKAFIEQDRAAKEFARTLAGINADLLEQQGLLPQAAGIRFDLGAEKIRTKITTERDSAVNRGDTSTAAEREADLSKLDRQRGFIVAQAKLNSIGETGVRVQNDLAAATERAQIAADTGAVTETESLRIVSDARLQAVDDLQQVATAFDAVARAAGDPRSIQQARALQLEVDKLAASADLVREKFATAFTDPFESAIDKIISGTASLKDVFKGLISDITRDLAKIATQDFTKQLFSQKGSLGGAVDFASGLFGGKPTNATASPNVAGSIASAVGGGTDVAASTAAATAMTTLATTTATADAAIVALSTTVPLADTVLLSLGTTTALTDAALSTLSSSAFSAAIALEAAASSAAGSAGSSAASGVVGLIASAKGNVFSGGAIMPFAKGGAFDNSNVAPFAKGGIKGIVSNPTLFPMSGGKTGLMGEAGPEAIMPLTRGKEGLSITMIDERGKAALLPVTRDQAGRMAVRGQAKAFASGGVFSGGDLQRTASTVFGMRGSEAAASGQGAKESIVVHNNFAISGPTNAASQGQIAAAASRGVERAKRNR